MMPKFNLGLGEILGILTFIGGIVAWWEAKTFKRYAAERDFHVILESQNEILKRQTEILEELKHGSFDTRSELIALRTVLERKI